MTEWAQIRIEAQLRNRLIEYRKATGVPASSVVKIAVERYLDEGEQSPVIPRWLRQLEENIRLVDELKRILNIQKEDAHE